MANNFDSNFTRKLAKVFLKKFESTRVHSKNVDTQLLKINGFKPDTGDTVDFKRPTDYVTKRTADGDISGGNRSDIITGKASGVVQDYFTVDVDYDEADEAIKIDQLDTLLAPMATRIVTDLELDFAAYMMKNTALLAGTVGTAASTWDHIAEAGAVMDSHGAPKDMPWYYTVNPFTQRNLASNQRSLGAGGSAGSLIADSIKRATIADMFAGFDKVMTATTLPSYTNSAVADRAGTLTANPTVTYVGAKDTMTQVLAVTAMGANAVVSAGETVQITGRNRLNLSTRQLILDDAGAAILWTGTVTADVTLGAAGEGNLTVTGPAIFEATGAYNTVDSAPISGDVITRLGAASAIIQPNLFWHKQAFSIGSVPIKKLHSTDTVATTEDGLQIRVSKYADGDANKQIVRFDFRPAYGVMNPFLAGQGFGSV